jgi:hypothetical protein
MKYTAASVTITTVTTTINNNINKPQITAVVKSAFSCSKPFFLFVKISSPYARS